MPPYDPFTDVALLWGVVRVLSCEPASPTWRNPGVVTLAVEQTLRGPLPAQVTVCFEAPREAGQARFYAVRSATPGAPAGASASRACNSSSSTGLARATSLWRASSG